MRQRKKHNLGARFADQLPVECANLRLPLALTERELRMNLLQRNPPARRIVRHAPQKQRLGLR
jgi:DNA-binding transcriptional regulator LsrR (DeoR family)